MCEVIRVCLGLVLAKIQGTFSHLLSWRNLFFFFLLSKHSVQTKGDSAGVLAVEDAKYHSHNDKYINFMRTDNSGPNGQQSEFCTILCVCVFMYVYMRAGETVLSYSLAHTHRIANARSIETD